MKYWIDTEFDGFGGTLLSLAIVAEDNRYLYLVYPGYEHENDYEEPWVVQNVLPIMYSVPEGYEAITITDWDEGAKLILEFFRNDSSPTIISDWPDDIKYFCQAIMVGPGRMVSLDNLTFKMFRVDAYPTALEGAVQHNALWDALALQQLFI